MVAFYRDRACPQNARRRATNLATWLKRAASRRQMAPQRIEKLQFAPGNRMAPEARNPQDLVRGRHCRLGRCPPRSTRGSESDGFWRPSFEKKCATPTTAPPRADPKPGCGPLKIPLKVAAFGAQAF